MSTEPLIPKTILDDCRIVQYGLLTPAAVYARQPTHITPIGLPEPFDGRLKTRTRLWMDLSATRCFAFAYAARLLEMGAEKVIIKWGSA